MIKLIISFFVSLLGTFIIYIIKLGFITDKKRNKLLKDAIEKNHILKGVLIKQRIIRRKSINSFDNANLDEYYEEGTYQYEYNNKLYKAKIVDKNLKREIDLFYISNPKRATSEFDLGKTEINIKKYFILLFLITYLIF